MSWFRSFELRSYRSKLRPLVEPIPGFWGQYRLLVGNLSFLPVECHTLVVRVWWGPKMMALQLIMGASCMLVDPEGLSACCATFRQRGALVN